MSVLEIGTWPEMALERSSGLCGCGPARPCPAPRSPRRERRSGIGVPPPYLSRARRGPHPQRRHTTPHLSPLEVALDGAGGGQLAAVSASGQLQPAGQVCQAFRSG